jgi:hypothetical protein
MAKQPPSQADRGALVTHLYYEVAMLRGGMAELKARNFPGVMKLDRADPMRIARTSFLETALLHARVLHDFLTEAKYDDDVWAGHYIARWQPTAPLDRIRSGLKQAINKQLAHFSGKRLQQQRFPMDAIEREVLADVRKFIDHPANAHQADLIAVRNLLDVKDWPTTVAIPTSPITPILAGGS